MSGNAFAMYWFVMFPAALLCLQYGWDMLMDDVMLRAEADQED